MPQARIDTGDEVLTGEYDDGVVTADGESYVAGEDGTLLTPVEPETVYCMGRNYAAYLEENADVIQNNLDDEPEFPEQIHFFLKGPTCVIGPGDPIPYPSFSEKVGYAGELAAVMGRECKNVDPEEVADAVRGYTILNDLDAKDVEGVTEMKVFDGSAPIGPAIADVDPTSLEMKTTISGEVRQDASTSAMYRSPAEAISELSERVTLKPNDVIAMGSPANPGTVERGDEIEIWYEGIGTLRNTVE